MTTATEPSFEPNSLWVGTAMSFSTRPTGYPVTYNQHPPAPSAEATTPQILPQPQFVYGQEAAQKLTRSVNGLHSRAEKVARDEIEREKSGKLEKFNW
jgi:hypothetical protein